MPSTRARQNNVTAATGPARAPMIFLAGPPGSGKTSLGSRACEDLELTFLDLSRPAPSAGDPESGVKELETAITDRSADVVALSWSVQQERKVLVQSRRAGELVLLWAHPLEMQARSGHADPLFTPVGRLKTGDGFGRKGTGCKEFRRLHQACPEALLLVGLSLDDAAEQLKELLAALHEEAELPPAKREGLDWWVEKWTEDHDADPQAAEVLVDAMARYTLHLRSNGASPRTLSGIYWDLDAAAMLVFMYDPPKPRNVLSHFSFPPWEIEFARKFSDSPRLVARYARNLAGFARFLQQSGMLAHEEEEDE